MVMTILLKIRKLTPISEEDAVMTFELDEGVIMVRRFAVLKILWLTKLGFDSPQPQRL